MNSLSWLLYWAAVCDNIGGSLGLISVLLGLAFVPCTIAYIVVNYCAADGEESSIKAVPFTGRLWKYNLTAFLTFMVIFTFVPDKKTVYAIAASEVGEQVMKSETVQGVASEASKALQSWIKNQMTTPKEEKKN